MSSEGAQLYALTAARGDDEALAALVRTHHQRLSRFAQRVCRDDFDADDAVQEAFARLVVRRDVVAAQQALSWLMTVVRHACFRLLRPFQRQRRALGDRDETTELVSHQLSPQAALEQWDLVHQVHASIAALEPPYREVLVLRELQGLSGAETCRALGLDEATMKTRLHRARTQLRASLSARR